MKTYTYDELVEKSGNIYGLIVLTKKDDYKNSGDNILVTNGIFKGYVNAGNILSEKLKTKPGWFRTTNPFIIENINKYLEQNYNDKFTCISTCEECVTRDSLLKIRCNRCGEIIMKTLHNMRKVNNKSGKNRNIVVCPNCDARLESLHALVLKQIFKYYYPDTVEEDPSCINPNTNCVMKTDIVNHKLKIAIEIQGGWHEREKQKERDKIKKDYWTGRGYKFYDYKIKDVSVLEYVQYFFPNINEIPEWVKFDYSNKLNLKQIQNLLNDGMKVQDIAKKLNINDHRIYDALHENKLYYPDNYIKSTRRPIVMLDMHKNYIKEYDTYKDAALDNNIDVSGIISCVYTKRYYSNGNYWVPKDLYITNDYYIPESRTEKFYRPVNKFDKEHTLLNTFDDMYQAGKDIGVVASKIYKVVENIKKSVKGFCYEYA